MRARVLAVAGCVLLAGCASSVAPSVDPQAGNYGIVQAARETISQALRATDWRVRAGAAMYALRSMLALIPPVSGLCAEFVSHTYNELRDLMDAYRGENFAPLARIVARDPSLSSVCPEGVR